MKILSAKKKLCIEIITDEPGYNRYRRFGSIYWEVKIDGNWRQLVTYSTIEELYLKGIKDKNDVR